MSEENVDENPAPEASADPAPEPKNDPAPEPKNDPWHASFDDETRGWLENKGLHGKEQGEAIQNLVKWTRDAEKQRGVTQDRLLTLPLSLDDPEALKPIFQRLGAPEKLEDYGIAAPEDADKDAQSFINGLAETFHNASLTKAQAKAVFEAIDGKTQAIHEAQQAASEAENAAGIAELEREWGETFELNKAIAMNVAKKIGATEAEIDALQEAMGSNAAVIRLFNRMGQKSGVEAEFVDGDKQGGLGVTTPEGANARRKEMLADPEMKKEILSKNPHSRIYKEYRALLQLASQAA